MANKAPSFLSDFKLKLSAKPLAQGAKPPAFVIGIYRNNPQFTVFTGHDNGSGLTMISAGMDIFTFRTVMLSLRELATNQSIGACKFRVDNKKPIPKEERTDPKIKLKTTSETWIGKDEDGKCWMSLVSTENEQAPKIKFYIGSDYYHTYNANAEVSKIIVANKTVSFCDTFISYIDEAIKISNTDEKGNDRSGGQNGGGNKSYGNNKPNTGQKHGGASGGGGFDTNDFDDGDFDE